MTVLRTPDSRFDNLPDFPFEPCYVMVNGMRVHYVDEGRGAPILCLHGEPSWSFLYRKMIPPLAAQHRVLAMDWIGFGRSDKVAEIDAYTFDMHLGTLLGFLEALDLREITLVVQDWGGLLGLTAAAHHPERFARLVIMNTFLPSGAENLGDAFMQWRAFAERLGTALPVGMLFRRTLAPGNSMTDAEVAAYEAPFPDERYKAGAAAFPLLVPTSPEAPGAAEMRAAREKLAHWHKPALVMFSDSDPIMRGGDRFFRRLIPTAADQPEIVIAGAGHFLQEEQGPVIAGHIRDFIAATPLSAAQ